MRHAQLVALYKRQLGSPFPGRRAKVEGNFQPDLRCPAVR